MRLNWFFLFSFFLIYSLVKYLNYSDFNDFSSTLAFIFVYFSSSCVRSHYCNLLLNVQPCQPTGIQEIMPNEHCLCVYPHYARKHGSYWRDIRALTRTSGHRLGHSSINGDIRALTRTSGHWRDIRALTETSMHCRRHPSISHGG